VASFVDLGDDQTAGLQRWLDHLGDLAALGVEHVIISAPRPWDDATLEAVCSVLPDVHAISTGA
jgi:hypothetical protein